VATILVIGAPAGPCAAGRTQAAAGCAHALWPPPLHLVRCRYDPANEGRRAAARGTGASSVAAIGLRLLDRVAGKFIWAAILAEAGGWRSTPTSVWWR
jgi:hypothetical protein